MENYETVTLDRGFTLRIYQDWDAENPWDAWDFQPPIATYSDRRLKDEDNLIGQALRHVTEDALSDHWQSMPKDIRDAFETEVDSRRLAVDTIMADSSVGDQMKLASLLYGIAGIQSITATSRGHSQGDWAELLLVATPEWLEKTGVKPEDAIESLKADVQTWTAWAWGDVYGYQLFRPDGEKTDESCWGFYGSDHSKSGLLEGVGIETAIKALDSEIEQKRDIISSLFSQRLRVTGFARASIIEDIRSHINFIRSNKDQ